MTDAQPLAWTLRAIARLERRGGVREPRLTEADHATWRQFRRRLGWADYVAILHEDLAGAFPLPFDLSRWEASPLEGLDDAAAEALIADALTPDARTSAEFLRDACAALGLPAGGAYAELTRLEPHHRVLELPGAGGRIAASLVERDPEISFATQFTFVADSDAERLAIGIAAVELRANEPRVLTRDAARVALLAPDTFDKVLGLKRSDAARALATPEARLI